MQKPKKRIRASSCLEYVLEALVPFTESNLKLIYRPNQFFNDLDTLSKYKKRTLQNAFYKLKKSGYVEMDQGIPKLTQKGLLKLQYYKPKKLKRACLMVIFDIPEEERNKRSQVRTLLKELKFVQSQKSVWISKYDARDYLTAEILQFGLQDYIKVFEARQLQ